MERGAVTSTIAGPVHYVESMEEEEEKGERKNVRVYNEKTDRWESAENRSVNDVARDAALIISNGSCELFFGLRLGTVFRPPFAIIYIRIGDCARVCVEKARKQTARIASRGATPHRTARPFAERKGSADTSRRGRREEIHKSSQKTATNSIF